MYYAFPLVLAVLAVAAFASAALWAVKHRAALRNAHEAYEDWSRESPQALRGLSEDDFTAAFMRANGPQGQAAATYALIAVLLATPLILVLFRLLWSGIWAVSGRSAFYEEGLLMWRFALFFAVAAGWTGIAALAARHYHSRAPGSLREEMIRQAADRNAAARKTAAPGTTR